jgi:hypothetical protein
MTTLKRLLTILAWFALAVPLFATQITLNANLADITGTAVTSKAYMTFTLQNTVTQIPVVTGGGAVIVPAGPQYPDNTGLVSVSLTANDTITPIATYYRICVFQNGLQYRCNDYLISTVHGLTQVLSTLTPLNPPPAPAPPLATVPPNEGGTGATSNPPVHGVAVAEGALPFNFIPPTGLNQCFIGSAGSDPLWGSCSGLPSSPQIGNGVTMLDAASFAGGSSTGGIQEAINAVTSPGEVYVSALVNATAAITMKAGVNVRCLGDNVGVTFTGATDGFVWPSTAGQARLYGCRVIAGNASNGKALDIEDAILAAGNVVVEDVRVTSDNPPTHVWAYGTFLENALLERFVRVFFESATVHIHTEGVSNSVDFDSINLTSNIAGVTYVDIQGGEPITFLGGEIEGNASGELVKVTQPGAAATLVRFIGTAFENANAAGIGIHANGAEVDCTSCQIHAATQLGFVIGDVSVTHHCKVVGGGISSWTLGANASENTIQGYDYTGSDPVDSSTGFNVLLNNNRVTDLAFYPTQSLLVGPGGFKFVPQSTASTPVQFLQATGSTHDLTQWLDSGSVVQAGVTNALQIYSNAGFTVGANTITNGGGSLTFASLLPIFSQNNANVGTLIPIHRFLAPNAPLATAGLGPYINIGIASSTDNSGAVGFANLGVGTTANYMWLGIYGRTPALSIFGSGVGIGTGATAPPAGGLGVSGNMLAGGIVDGLTFVGVTTGPAITLGATYKSEDVFNQDPTPAEAVTFALPPAEKGRKECVANSDVAGTPDTGVLRVDADGAGQYIHYNGARSLTGGYIISNGAAGDKGCFIATSATDWEFYPQLGTWTLH